MAEVVLEQSVVVAARNQLSTDLAGEAVILNLENGIYYGLNEVGADVWRLIQEPRSVADILDTLLETYDVERDHLRGDLLTLLANLHANALIEVTAEGAA